MCINFKLIDWESDEVKPVAHYSSTIGDKHQAVISYEIHPHAQHIVLNKVCRKLKDKYYFPLISEYSYNLSESRFHIKTEWFDNLSVLLNVVSMLSAEDFLTNYRRGDVNSHLLEYIEAHVVLGP